MYPLRHRQGLRVGEETFTHVDLIRKTVGLPLNIMTSSTDSAKTYTPYGSWTNRLVNLPDTVVQKYQITDIEITVPENRRTRPVVKKSSTNVTDDSSSDEEDSGEDWRRYARGLCRQGKVRADSVPNFNLTKDQLNMFQKKFDKANSRKRFYDIGDDDGERIEVLDIYEMIQQDKEALEEEEKLEKELLKKSIRNRPSMKNKELRKFGIQLWDEWFDPQKKYWDKYEAPMVIGNKMPLPWPFTVNIEETRRRTKPRFVSMEEIREVAFAAATLFKVSENSGRLAVEAVASNPNITKDCLDTDDCFILPIPDHDKIYVWTGQTTSGIEKNQGVKMAVNIKKAMGVNSSVKVFPQGNELAGFKQFFSDWETGEFSTCAE